MELIYAAVVSGIITVVGLVISRRFDQPKTEADLAQRWKQIAGETLDDWIVGRKERDAEIDALTKRLGTVEQAAAGGPFRINLEFTTIPLRITSQSISLVVDQEGKEE